MTRFEQEISGALGQWWKDHAEKEVAEAVAKADASAFVEANGAIKWLSNNHYIPDDFCEKLEYAGYNFSREATREARAFEQDEFLRHYRERYTGPSEEELAELRAVHGAGTVIVNVVTGQKIQL